MDSFRHIHHEIVKAMSEWLPSVLEFLPWDLSLADQRLLWESLHLQPDMVENLMRLGIRFEDDKLRVHPNCEVMPDAPQHIVATLLSIWQLAEWTESRWLSMARTCRRFLAARITGMHKMIDFLRAKPHCSQYYMNGWDKMNASVKHLFVVAGLAGGPTDFMLKTFFKDDRVPLVIGEVDAGVAEELVKLSNLPAAVWCVLACAVDGAVQGIRSDTIAASMTSVCFSMWRLDRVRHLPFSLCGPDAEAKLDAMLAREEAPADIVASKIRQLDEVGYPRETILAGISLIGQMSWSSMVVEQGHSACTRILRHHPQYHASMMAARSFFMQASTLLTGCQLERRLDRVRKRMARLKRKCPSKLSGRSVIASDLMRIAQNKRKAGIYKGKHIGKFIIKRHSKIWHSMSREAKRVAEREAACRREVAREKLASDLAGCRHAVKEFENQKGEAKHTVAPARMSSCKFSEVEKSMLNESFKKNQLTRDIMKRLREQALTSIDEPPSAVRRLLEGFPTNNAGDKKGPLLNWVRQVCKLRQYFKSSIFRIVNSAGQEQMLRIMFAMQNPLVAGFVVVEECIRVQRQVSPAAMMEDPSLWAVEFQIISMEWRWSDSIGFGDSSDSISVIRESSFLGGGMLGADEMWRPLDAVLRELPQVSDSHRRAEEGEHRRRHRPEDDMLRDNPWLLDVLSESAIGQGGGRHADDHGGAGAERSSEREATFEVDAGEVMEDLRRKREEVETGRGEEKRHFAWTVRGGAWTAARKGVSFDSYRAQAQSAEARQFAKDFGMATSATFALGRYGSDAAAVLADYWVDKMTWLYMLVEDSGGAAPTVADIEAFPEPPAALELAAQGDAHFCNRLQALRALAPLQAPRAA